MNVSRWVRRLAAALAFALLALPGCGSDESTGPKVGALSGTVLDSNGVPANGAAVEARYLPDPNQPTVARSTDANGHFSCGEVLQGRWALGVNFSPAWAAAETLDAPGAATVQVATAATAQGRAVLHGASAHANTFVRAPFPLATDETPANGTFFLEGLAAGTWVARLHHEGYRDTAVTFVVPAAGAAIVIPDIEMFRPGIAP